MVATTPVALIVDDEPDIRELLEITLGRMNVNSVAAANIATAKALLQQQQFSLCITDMKLPDGNGLELIELMQKNYPDTPVAMLTAHGNMETAIAALKAGAFDFVSKPVDLNVLRNLVSSALKIPAIFPKGSDRRSRNELLGDSDAMQQTRATINKVARSQAPVYISGESGTGKELVARLIHQKSPRGDKPFVAVNCGAIPSELMESELFGHKKGSFTGALTDKGGLFQAAHEGTLFLDEVADLPLHMQVKLLRAIQEKSIRPVGSQTESPIDIRVLCATHKDLEQLVKDGLFRQDLYYRLNVIKLEVPPLRERPEDIPGLCAHILSRICADGNCEEPKLDDEASDALMQYSYPGNVRELENILERSVTLCEDNHIRVQDLSLPEEEKDNEQLASTRGNQPLEEYLEHLEKDAILAALEAVRFNKTAAAKKLGITFRALRYRLKRLGLE